MRSLLLVVSAFAIFAGPALAALGSGSVYNIPTAQAWASTRNFARQFVQYKANDINGQIYYSCKRVDYADEYGEYSPPDFVCYEQKCKDGLWFNDKKWGCTIVVGPIPTEAPITEVITADDYCYRKGNRPDGSVYLQKYKKVTDRYYYWFVEGQPVLFQCAPGTYFNDDQTVDPVYWCQCIVCADCLWGSDLIFIKDFKNKALEKGLFFDSKAVAVGPAPKGLRGNVGGFDGSSSNIEVPFFQNNDFNQFFLNISFYRNEVDDLGLKQGLFYDGSKRSPDSEDFAPPAIYIVSTGPSTLEAGIYVDADDDSGRYLYTVSASGLNVGDWNEVKLRFDGSSSSGVLQLQVNGGEVVSVNTVQGSTVPNKIAALIGQSFDLEDFFTPYYFRGWLDDIAFYRAAIPF